MANCVETLEKTNERCGNEPFGGTDYCRLHGEWFRADLEVFREISEHFRMDVREYWTRSNFYLLVQGALVSVFVGIIRGEAPVGELPLIVGSLGFVVCVFWILAARQSVKWIGRWRKMTISIDKRIDRHAYYKIEEQRTGISTAEEITSFLPWVFALGWVVLLAWGA